MEITASHAVALTIDKIKHARALKGLLAGTLVFNLLDLVLTLFVVLTGIAIEANPVMARMLTVSPVAFGAVKIALVSMGVFIIWKHRQRPVAIFAGGVCCAAYAFVMLVHMQGVALASAAFVQ